VTTAPEIETFVGSAIAVPFRTIVHALAAGVEPASSVSLNVAVRLVPFAAADAKVGGVTSLTVMPGLVSAVLLPSVTSLAVTVREPGVFSVTENVFVPPTSAALEGSVAAESEEVIPTVSVEETWFQLASTALTVTVKAEPSSCALGLPVLPVASVDRYGR
jgi:hypothetical protein